MMVPQKNFLNVESALSIKSIIENPIPKMFFLLFKLVFRRNFMDALRNLLCKKLKIAINFKEYV